MAKYILEISNGAPILRGLDTNGYYHFGLDPRESDNYDGSLDNLGTRGLFSVGVSGSDKVYLPSTLAGEAVATGYIKFNDALFPTSNYSGLGLPAEFKLDALQVMPHYDPGTNVGADAHLVSNVASIDVSSVLGGGNVGVTASVSEHGWLSIEKAGDPDWVPTHDDVRLVFGAVAEADTSYVNDSQTPVDELYVFYNNGTASVDLWVAREPGAGDFAGAGWGNEVYSNASQKALALSGANKAVFYQSSVAASTYSASTLNGLTIDPSYHTHVKFIPNADVELLELSNTVYDAMESGNPADIWQFNPESPGSAMERIVDLLSLSDSDFLFAFAVVGADHPTARLIDLGEGVGEQYVGALVGNATELFQEISTGLGDSIYQLIDIGEYQGASTTKADILGEFAVASSLEGSATFVTLDAMVKVAELDVNSALTSLGVDYSATSEDNLQVEINTYYVDTLVVSDTMTDEAARILEIITTNDTVEANMWGDTTSLEINAAQSALALDLYTWSAPISDIEIINTSAGAVDLSGTDFGKDDIVKLTADTGADFIYDRSIDTINQLHAPATAVVGDGVKLILTQDFGSTPQFNIANDGTGVVEFIGQNDVGETIYGTTGSDVIIGGDGDDTLHGVSGADTFVFNTDGSGAGDGNDIIIGYDDSKGGDIIIIQNGDTALSQAGSYQEYLDSSGAKYFVDASGNYEYSGGTITLAEAQGLVSAVESKFEIVELKDERAGDIMTYGVKVKDAYAWSEFSSVKFGIEWDTSKYKFVENSVLLSHNAAMLNEMSVQFDLSNPNHPYYHNAANGFLDFSITGGIDGFNDLTSQTFTHTEYSINWGDMPGGANNVRLNDTDRLALTGDMDGWYARAKDGVVSFENDTVNPISMISGDLEEGLLELVNAVHTASDNTSVETVHFVYDDMMGGLELYQVGENTASDGVFNYISESNWTIPSRNEVADDYVAKFTMKRIDPEQAINELVLKYSNDSVIYRDNDGNKFAVASNPNSEASVFDYTTDQVTVNVRDADGHSSTTPTKLYVSSDTVSDGLSLVPVMQVGDLVKYNVVMNVASPTLRFNAVNDMPVESQIWITGAEIFEDSVMQIGSADMGNAGWDNDPANPETPPFMATAGAKALTAQVADTQFDFIKDELEGATDLTGVNVTHQLEITQNVGGLYPTTPLTTRSSDPYAPAVAQHAVAEFWARVDSDGIGFSYRNFTSDDMANATTKSYSSAISITSEDITGGSDTFTVNDGSNVAVLGDTLYKNPFSNMMAIDNADAVRALQVAVDDPMNRKFDAATYVAADFNKDGKVTGADAYDILVTSAFYSPADLMDPADPAYYNALLATPDWMFVEHDYQNGRDLIDLNMDMVTMTDPYFGPLTMANSVSFDRYFNKFVGETSKFDVTAILSGDANHSYIPANGSSAHLADYESILAVTNTATDVTAPGAETFAQAITVAPVGGGVTVTDVEFSFSSTNPRDILAVPGATRLAPYDAEAENIGSAFGLTEVLFNTTADGGVNFVGDDAASIDTIEEVVDATELLVEALETDTGVADTIVAYWVNSTPSTFVMVFDETAPDSGNHEISDVYKVDGTGTVILEGTSTLPPNVEGNLIIDTFIA